MAAGLVTEGSIPAFPFVSVKSLNFFTSSFAIAPFLSQGVNVCWEFIVFVSRVDRIMIFDGKTSNEVNNEFK